MGGCLANSWPSATVRDRRITSAITSCRTRGAHVCQSAERTIVSRHILEPTGKGNPRRWWAPWRRHGKRSAAWLRSARAQAPAFRPVPCERRPHGRRGSSLWPIQRSSNPYSAHRVARFYPRSRRSGNLIAYRHGSQTETAPNALWASDPYGK
jgi:hypothetical protein